MSKLHKLGLTIFCVFLHVTVFADSGQAYLDRFRMYSEWSQNLPSSPDDTFINFISQTSPLSQKLREKWLYQLAYNKDWAKFTHYYQDSSDTGLQCYEKYALYQLGQRQQAVESIKSLWLNGNSQPVACNNFFTLLLKNKEIDDQMITDRIVLALQKQNLSLAVYLLKQYTPAHSYDVLTLMAIHQNPARITQLTASGLNGEFYLYGLKRMLSTRMEHAIHIWQSAQTGHILTHAQQQDFLAHVALYKAIRNQPDAPLWFAKVNPAFYNDVLLGSQIRYDLKYKHWREAERLINQLQDKDNPCWQYWLARAAEAQGQKEKAVEIYQNLADTRSYYGFLASLRVQREFSFENEHAINNTEILRAYRPFTDQIKTLYLSKQTLQASRLLNDFVSELPKDDKSALAYWIDHDLQWHGKAVYLSNNQQLNNQLSLRFPLAYRETITTYAKNYQISPELIYAIIRQESAFRDDAVSSAGAGGLMQIMPATARVVSKSERISYSSPKQLFSSQKNINIGVAYLQQLAKRFKKHPILMAAAYNAGPKQVVFWLRTHPPKEMDIWIETLPWIETRNYLKNIIAFYAVYQYRMKEKPDLTPFMEGSVLQEKTQL